MFVAVDSDILSLLLKPSIDAPFDPSTEQPTERVSDRLAFFVAEMEKAKTRIIVPTPALAEFLVIADAAGPDYVTELDNQSIFSIESFDARAAIESAATTRAAIAKGNKKSGALGTWQCVKTDRQIVAIAKTRGATTIYSNDVDIANIARESGIEVVTVWQLPLPPEQQVELDFKDAGTISDTSGEPAESTS